MAVLERAGQAFGLYFRSERPLPGLRPWVEAAAEGSVVDVCWGEPAPLVEPIGASSLSGEGVFTFAVPQCASFAITARRIDIAPLPGVTDNEVRIFLLGSALGALLQLRGLSVLHGSAVALPDGTAAAFCGASTAGKSTTAAALMARGYPVLADDLTALRLDADGTAWCLPGLARTKLWRDALDTLQLAQHVDASTRLLPEHDKHVLPLQADGAPGGPVRLRWVFELHADDDAGLAFTAVAGMEKVSLLLRHAYRPGFILAMGRRGALMRAAASMAPTLRVHRIVRPRGVATLDAIVEWLETQWTPAGSTRRVTVRP